MIYNFADSSPIFSLPLVCCLQYISFICCVGAMQSSSAIYKALSSFIILILEILNKFCMITRLILFKKKKKKKIEASHLK